LTIPPIRFYPPSNIASKPQPLTRKADANSMSNKSIIKLSAVIAVFGAGLCLPARGEEAEAIWTKTCAACHGKDGKGDTRMGRKVDVKDYTDAKVQGEMKDEEAIKAIKEGIKDDKGKERMKGYGDKYSDAEIKSLVEYVRGFKPK
jgi:cytochrome c6